MTSSIIVLAVLTVSFLLFVTGWMKPDLIAMLVLVVLVLSGVIHPGEAFAGFSSFAVITIAGLMIIGSGLEKTGVVAIVASASFFIPVIRRLCRQMKVPQAKILLPMASAALIGANLSLIGASHNLVVDSLLKESTGEGETEDPVEVPESFPETREPHRLVTLKPGVDS